MTSVLERRAIICQGTIWSYSDLDRASRSVAAGLLGGRHDLDEARVAFLATPGPDYAAVQRGIWRAGGVAVPLAVSHPPAEIDYVLRDTGAEVVVGDPRSAEWLEPVAMNAGARFVTAGALVALEPAAALPDLSPDRRAMIIYTSGTTARPKGVVSTHANVHAQVSALVEAWGWTAADRLLLVLPLHHVHGIVNGLGSALAVSATCEVMPGFDAELVWERLASGEVSVFTAVPTIYHRLIASWDAAPAAVQRTRSAGARGLRLMMSGSAALPVQTLERWREITGHTLLERYGMTEIGMALSNPLHGVRRPGFVGAPLPRVEVRLVDDAGREIAGGPGELEVRGPAVFREYWRRPAETREAFRDGWFRTGDMAVFEDGSFRLLGRTSVDIIKSGGFKVSALEIECVLREHAAVADCAVVGVGDTEWGERVGVAVELRPGTTLALDDLQRWARERLAPYKIPRQLVTVPALPRNAMGKVLKPELAALLSASSNRESR